MLEPARRVPTSAYADWCLVLYIIPKLSSIAIDPSQLFYW
jgi:hypothetical protein